MLRNVNLLGVTVGKAGWQTSPGEQGWQGPFSLRVQQCATSIFFPFSLSEKKMTFTYQEDISQVLMSECYAM